MLKSYIFLTVAFVFNGVANVLMKAGMKDAPEVSGLGELIKQYLTNVPVMVGIVLFAANVLAYTQALSKIPLSIAYPVMVSMSGLIVIGASLWLFKETITWMQVAGFVLIIAGVYCVAR